MYKLTAPLYLGCLIIYKGSNPKTPFDESMFGVEVPILHLERGVGVKRLIFSSKANPNYLGWLARLSTNPD